MVIPARLPAGRQVLSPQRLAEARIILHFDSRQAGVTIDESQLITNPFH
jgi:hypothetical protein